MAARIFTRVIGIIFLVCGACAFVPALNGRASPEVPTDIHVKLHFEYLFRQLPMNYLLAGILIGFGVAGLWTSFDTRAARIYDRVVFVSALVFMALGFCPQPLSDLFGFLPLYGWTTGLFLATALLSFYFAFFDGPMPVSATQPVFRQ